MRNGSVTKQRGHTVPVCSRVSPCSNLLGRPGVCDAMVPFLSCLLLSVHHKKFQGG